MGETGCFCIKKAGRTAKNRGASPIDILFDLFDRSNRPWNNSQILFLRRKEF